MKKNRFLTKNNNIIVNFNFSMNKSSKKIVSQIKEKLQNMRSKSLRKNSKVFKSLKKMC